MPDEIVGAYVQPDRIVPRLDRTDAVVPEYQSSPLSHRLSV